MSEGRLLEEALTIQEQTGERVWEAELHRLRGELERERQPGAAESAFSKALAVARMQGALGFELRAAMGLAGLLAHQDRASEARAVLEPVYARFTEGFDTADLRAAREMLVRLLPAD
jgi:predicted ATPase